MANTYIASYDFGTSGVKAVIFDCDKDKVIASCNAGYPLISPHPGWAEQNCDDYWDAVCIATKEAVKKAGVDKKDIKGVVFGTQGMGVIPIDENDNVLYNNITWLDGRAGKQAQKINEILGVEATSDKDVWPKFAWIKENLPDVYKRQGHIDRWQYSPDCSDRLIETVFQK